MLTRRLATAVVVLATALSTGATSNGQERSSHAASYRMLVFETRNCFYCDHFRYAVAPVYQNSKFAAAAPLQYIDVRQTDTRRLELSGPITVAPTTVLTRDGKEIARIAGVTAPQDFMVLVEHMMP